MSFLYDDYKRRGIEIQVEIYIFEDFKKVVITKSVQFCGQISGLYLIAYLIEMLKYCDKHKVKSLVKIQASQRKKEWYEEANANKETKWIFGLDGLLKIVTNIGRFIKTANTYLK